MHNSPPRTRQRPPRDLSVHDGFDRAVGLELVRPVGAISDGLANDRLLEFSTAQVLETFIGQHRSGGT